MLAEHLGDVLEVVDQTSIVQVVTDARGYVFQAIEREQQVALGVALDPGVQRVVLEDHRQPLAVAVEVAREARVAGDGLPQRDREVRLDRQVDLEIRGAEARDGLAKAAVQGGP